MNRHIYYEGLKDLARTKRGEHAVDTTAFGLREVRKIYKKEGISIDPWPLPPKIKALYMCSDGDYSVAIRSTLPDEPKIFAMIHELKHHYCDQDILSAGLILCGDYNANELIEKGAEVFAAEFIYPEAEFVEDIRPLNIAAWQAENIVAFKHRCKAKISYKFLCKRLERLQLITTGQFDGIKFKKLEEQILGIPFYKRRRRI